MDTDKLIAVEAASPIRESLLASLVIQTAPAVAHDVLASAEDKDFEEGKHYSVAVVSGTAILTLVAVGEEPAATLTIPAGIVTARFNSGVYTNVEAGADSSVVVETYAA